MAPAEHHTLLRAYINYYIMMIKGTKSGYFSTFPVSAGSQPAVLFKIIYFS